MASGIVINGCKMPESLEYSIRWKPYKTLGSRSNGEKGPAKQIHKAARWTTEVRNEMKKGTIYSCYAPQTCDLWRWSSTLDESLWIHWWNGSHPQHTASLWEAAPMKPDNGVNTCQCNHTHDLKLHIKGRRCSVRHPPLSQKSIYPLQTAQTGGSRGEQNTMESSETIRFSVFWSRQDWWYSSGKWIVARQGWLALELNPRLVNWNNPKEIKDIQLPFSNALANIDYSNVTRCERMFIHSFIPSEKIEYSNLK